MEEQQQAAPTWKKAHPFNLTDEQWIQQVRDQMNGRDPEHPGLHYGKNAQEGIIREHIRSIEHNKHDRVNPTPRELPFGIKEWKPKSRPLQ